MSALVRVTDVSYMGGRCLRVTFSDNLVRELDFADVLDGALASLDNDDEFGRVELNGATGTIGWPSGIDLDPDVLHGDEQPANGKPPVVRREYRLQQTS